MNTLSNKLEQILRELPELVQGITEQDFLYKRTMDKWSKQEILGHLCDSASINHLRFVKVILNDTIIELEGYEQIKWVTAHDYQNSYTREELLTVWKNLNLLILKTMQNVSQTDQEKHCITSDGREITLYILFEDYLKHVAHHMKQIEN